MAIAAARIYRWFRRPRVTISIIVILVALYFMGLIIPQKLLFDSKEKYDAWKATSPFVYSILDAIGFTEIYKSPIALGFLALFFANLIAVIVERIPVVLRRALISDPQSALAWTAADLGRSERRRRLEFSRTVDSETVATTLAEFFRKAGWYVIQAGSPKRTLAVRHRLSAFGFLLFHISFLLCLSGGLLIYYTRFSGDVVLTEGQAFEGDMKQVSHFESVPKIMQGLPSLSFTLEKAEILFEDTRPTALNALLRIRYWDEERRERLSVNRPLDLGSLSILAVDAGVSPLVILRETSTGREIDGAWVSLDVFGGREDVFTLQGRPELSFHVIFFPDYVEENGVESTRSMNLLNPAFRLAVKEGDRLIGEGTIRQGEALKIDGEEIRFADLRKWVKFQVVREYGTIPLVGGFGLAVTGLVMRLIFYRKEIRAVPEDGALVLLGRSEYYPHSFEEEMDDLVDRIRTRLEGA